RNGRRRASPGHFRTALLTTSRAVIDVHDGKLSLRVDTVNHDGKWTEVEEEEDSNEVQAVSFYLRTDPVEPLEWKDPEIWLKPSSIKPPKLELKELPEHLKYAFLQENNQLPVVISSVLSTIEKATLLEVLRNHKGINELDEMRLDVYESSISYKDRSKRWHDKRIKVPTNYKRGDKVLLFNLRLRLFRGKLKSRWYGPFSISKDMKNGTIKLYDEDGNEFIVNKQRVKPYKNIY
nr:hypothetical protein [Tanacetum cinerariifolium]